MGKTNEAHGLRQQYEYESKDRGETPSQDGFLNYAKDRGGDLNTSVLAASESFKRRPRR